LTQVCNIFSKFHLLVSGLPFKVKIKSVGEYSVIVDDQGNQKKHVMFRVKYYSSDFSGASWWTWAPWWWVYLSSGYRKLTPFILDRDKSTSTSANVGRSEWVPVDFGKLAWNLEPMTSEEKAEKVRTFKYHPGVKPRQV
jgi:hypothetical protein